MLVAQGIRALDYGSKGWEFKSLRAYFYKKSNMRIQRHPVRIQTLVQLKDGSVYGKRWLYYRSALSLDVDMTTNPKWRKNYINYLKYTGKKKL